MATANVDFLPVTGAPPAGLRTGSLYCPFTSNVHPDAAAVHEGSVLWARALGMLPTEQHVRRAQQAKVGWLIARAFPTARSSELQLIADWTLLFCALDDQVEKRVSSTDVEAYLEHLLDLFRGDSARLSDDSFAAGMIDLRSRLLAMGLVDPFTSFTARMRELFAGFVTEARNRENAQVPDLASYVPLRAVTVGLRVIFALADALDWFNLSDRVREHPAIQRLATRTSNIVGWANDLFTYEKEIFAGELHNLVLVLMNELRLPLAEAAVQAVELHDNEVRSFLEEIELLPSFGAAEADVQRYVEMMRRWIRGHLDWAHETGRYRPFDDHTAEHVAQPVAVQVSRGGRQSPHVLYD